LESILNALQFLQEILRQTITPGPVVITFAFIGYLVAGVAGATAAALGIFLPVHRWLYY
jgi:chromate transporter